MPTNSQNTFRYAPKKCCLLRQPVWAIMMQQPNGSWKIVNCLDKEEGCVHLKCAFTTDEGTWPYESSEPDVF